jgi:dihydrofolate synthase/folylpolyglutamate synthase
LQNLTRTRDNVHPVTEYDAALEWLFARTRAGDARSAERSRGLLETLGRPDLQFSAIHVIGTNGKGSVCAMLDAGLRSSVARVGRFTSPHLLDFRERIAVNGEFIAPETVLEFLTWAREHASNAAFFDLTFVMGMGHFARSGVEMAVVEAGVGGTGDASNALERIALTVLTNVDLDHEAVIGVGPEDSVLKNIALEKAGAIRAGTPVVTAARGDALAVVRRVALERGARLHELTEDNALFALPRAPRMRGVHQLENARLTAAALRLLGHGEAAVDAALEATWPGRLEMFQRGGQRVWLDGAHNPAGARALASSLAGQRYTLVFGAMARKNVPAILEPLLSLANSVHFASPGTLGVDPVALEGEYGGTGHSTLEAALEAALLEGGDVLVAGSLYLVGAARPILQGWGFR